MVSSQFIGDHFGVSMHEPSSKRGAAARRPWIIEEQRVGPLDLPGGEEVRPVEIGDELGDRIFAGKSPGAEEARVALAADRRPIDRE